MKELEKKQIEEMIDKAINMMDYSYVPYSHFHVGAALLAKNGTVYGGCNIENAGYTPSNCAERTAFFKAVSEGVLEFDAICVVGGMNKELKQDLRSLGCPEEIMKELDHTSDEDRKLMLLKKYRKQLLENVHFEQKRLQDLDFIIFQMKKH